VSHRGYRPPNRGRASDHTAGIMGWTAGHLRGPFTARAAIEFDLGTDFAARVIDTVRYGKVIYAAVRAPDRDKVFGLVLLTKREKGVLLCDMGPVEDRAPARILHLMSAPSNDHSRAYSAEQRPYACSSARPTDHVKGIAPGVVRLHSFASALCPNAFHFLRCSLSSCARPTPLPSSISTTPPVAVWKRKLVNDLRP
jgi:hypothetical protein